MRYSKTPKSVQAGPSIRGAGKPYHVPVEKRMVDHATGEAVSGSGSLSVPSVAGDPKPYKAPVVRDERSGDKFPSRMPGKSVGSRGMGVVKTGAEIAFDDAFPVTGSATHRQEVFGHTGVPGGKEPDLPRKDPLGKKIPRHPAAKKRGK